MSATPFAKENRVHCIDCLVDEVKVLCSWDDRQSGHICPRCDRVFSDLIPLTRLHYATEKGCKRRIRRDQIQRARTMSAATAALGKRILEN